VKNILLDTHTVLYWINKYEKLSDLAKITLEDEEIILYLSLASFWEIAIKTSNGKLSELHGGITEFLYRIQHIPVSVIPINLSYIKALEKLPKIHKDPFDRIIITTAQTENMPILTSDQKIHEYQVETIW